LVALRNSIALALLVALALPARAEVGSGDQRIALSGFFLPMTGQSGSEGVWAGVEFGYSFIHDWLTLVIGSGYTAAGGQAGEGRQGLAPLAGLEIAVPVHPWVSPFVRGLGGPIVELTDSKYKQWDLAAALVSVQLGVRFRYVEVFASGGTGPSDGFNGGFGLSFVLPFGTAPGGGGGASGFLL
jgi:hypothetical protein